MLKNFKFKQLNWKRLFKRAALSSILLFVALLAVREIGVACNPFPCELIENPPAAKIVLDRQENIIWAETNKEKNWQIPVSLSDISPWVIKATICAEDSRFYDHSGVDNIAVVRAALQSVFSGRIKSGASTLTMQMVKMAHLQGRSFEYKFKQICEAVSLERQRSKEWILERYLNYAPYGGNIIGIEAASRFYFRKRAKDLNLYEASLLAGLPKAPSSLRPDRFPELASKRQSYVLKRMLEEGKIKQIPVTRQYKIPESRPGDCRLGLAQSEEHVANLFNTFGEISSTIDSSLQNNLREMTKTHLNNFPGIKCAALVLIDNKSSELRAIVSVGSDKINTALSARSSGSTLKPFIYLALMNKGALTSVSQLNDGELDLKDYEVRNFNDSFIGNVSLRKALTSSLNTPAVRALKKLGVNNFMSDLKNLGITSLNRSADNYGLSLALGGGEVNLLELTNAYSCLARKGEFRTFQIQRNGSIKKALYDKGSVECLNSILRSEALGSGMSGRISWKTGTSNGFRDAWCIAYNDEITVGVWMGNENGEPDKNLIGSVAATPLAYKIFNELYPHGVPSPPERKFITKKEVCSKSGLRLTGNCQNEVTTEVSNSVTLANCQECFQLKDEAPILKNDFKVLSPQSGKYKCVDNVRLELKSNREAKWFVNGGYVGAGNIWYDFDKGDYTISCVTQSGAKLTVINVE